MTSEKVTKNMRQITDVMEFIGYDEELLKEQVLPLLFSYISLVPGRTDIGIGKLTGTDAKIVNWHSRKLVENRLIEYDHEFNGYFEYATFDREMKRLLSYASKGASFFILKKVVTDKKINLKEIKNFTKITLERRIIPLVEMNVLENVRDDIYELTDHGHNLFASIKHNQLDYNVALLTRLRQEKIELDISQKEIELLVAPSIGYPFMLSLDPVKTLIQYGEP